MQLIFDSDTDADIRKVNMAVINSENINEKFSSDRLLEKFSQNECVDNRQEDVKKMADAEVTSKDNNIENNSDTGIDSINNHATIETVFQHQTVEIKNEEDSKIIIPAKLHNHENTNLNTHCNESDKNSILERKLSSELTENVETECNEDILRVTMSEICNKKETVKTNFKNSPSLRSKEEIDCNNEENAIPLITLNDSLENMDVDQESNTENSKISIEVGSVEQSCKNNIENLKPIVASSKENVTMSGKQIDLGNELVENTALPQSEAISPNKLIDHVKQDAVNININLDSIIESSNVKLDKSPKEEVANCETFLPMAVSDKNIKTGITQVTSETHVDPNTIEINDDSSQDDISQKEPSVNNSTTVSPTNKDNKLKGNNVASLSNENIKEEISNSSVKELGNLNEKDEQVCISKEDINNVINKPRMEEDKSLDSNVQSKSIEQKKDIQVSLKSKLSNTLDILSDDDEYPVSGQNKNIQETNKQCINVEDDDDILLIDDEDASNGEKKIPADNLSLIPAKDVKEILENNQVHAEKKLEKETNNVIIAKDMNELDVKDEKNTVVPDTEKLKNEAEIPSPPSKPLLPTNFLSLCKKNVSEMTRNDLEEFCIMKIVESVVDRGNIGEMKSQLKKMALSLDEHRNKIKSITKQNQDLQVILRSVQEACRKNSLVTPLKITRSVGIQVVTAEKSKQKATAPSQNNLATTSPAKPVRSPSLQNKSKQNTTPSQNIPVPRLVPAKSSPSNQANQTSNNKVPINLQPTAIRPAVPRPEKRPFSKSQTGSDTVDLTDDEPPNKVVTRPGNQAVRVISPQNLMPPQRVPTVNSPRKVYIPIGGGQVSNVRPTQQAYMLKPVNNQNVRQRVPGMRRVHPAPLPESGKQYQAVSWKGIPPAPEIKLSKVENGIVISWKLDNYREDVHENIASYQIYAYQETPSPPSTNLWKKIGDVKALPLPMACTLTQFVPGFKYYFAVRAVDVRSRQGSFSNPGNIMLLNK
ncbi:activating transcription factor 7-interacting protein 2 [Pieris brassicae]|uniref:activating transcription factor 7-interacting protein 2 n=1 Tax=Pieris brassicae TaxID=7116 RepID=UPI001E6618F3|nr:activating transcription factor 7-interacting protein 2 [Pieris brassicae]XP_045525345.1 activating transcription factor 7-interacting protein 2 [Pieris brassicae]